MTRILVIGGTGFVGSHLTKKLLEGDSEVAIFSRSREKMEKISLIHGDRKPALYEGDVKNYEDVLEVFKDFRPTYIFNCAALLSRGVSEADELEAVLVNEQGTKNVVDAILAIKEETPVQSCVIFGTSMEYGMESKNLSEDVLCKPLGSYAVAKYNATVYAQKMAHMHKLPIVLLRVFTPYGPNMHPDSLVAKTCARALEGQEILLSSPDVTRDFIYIDDLLDLTLKIAEITSEYQGEIFNAGSGQSVSLQELVTHILKESGSGSHVTWDDKFKSIYDERVWQADMVKTFKTVNWRPVTDLPSGIRHMIYGRLH
jgi:nucleoside-diphosphate-sugar epimerase